METIDSLYLPVEVVGRIAGASAKLSQILLGSKGSSCRFVHGVFNVFSISAKVSMDDRQKGCAASINLVSPV